MNPAAAAPVVNPGAGPQSAPAVQAPAAAPTGPVAPQAIAPNGAPLQVAAPSQAVPNVSAIAIPGVPQYDTAGLMANIAKLYQIPSEALGTSLQVRGQAYNAEMASNQHLADLQLQQKLTQDKLDPSKYQLQSGKDGQIEAIGPGGEVIPVGEYISRTGNAGLKEAMSAMQNSPNQKDQQFVSDYNNFQQFMNAAINKGTSKEAAQQYDFYVKANPGLANMNPQQASQLFIQQYGDKLGLTAGNQAPSSPQFTPQYQPSIANYVSEKSLFGYSPVGSSSTASSSPYQISSQVKR